MQGELTSLKQRWHLEVKNPQQVAREEVEVLQLDEQ
jgi:hypothetical protein